MRYFVIIAAVTLFFLHQDIWLWDDRTLLLGFLPSGLAYHAAFSVAASLVWALAVVYAWPSDLEEETLEAIQEAHSDNKGASV